MSCKLRDLIRAVRNAKTSSDEREIISKECAAIRTAFKEGKGQYRCRNVGKLVYINLLGYSAEFGQMECIRLMTGEGFMEKRIGYLSLSLLVDESHEVLTLVENQLKMDLAHRSDHVVSLALGAIANLAGEDMARDLAHQVSSLLGHNNPNLKKKACLASLRILRRVPSLAEMLLEKMSNILHEKNHGVLLGGLALVNEGLRTPEGRELIPQFRTLLPKALYSLKNLDMATHMAEHDFDGVADPFLQVKLLQFLRVIGEDDIAASETMCDTLAQVVTNAEKTLSCGNAILYECANTIIAIESPRELRVLAVNVLARFLEERGNNMRYVALNALTKVVDKDATAVQTHKNTIVDCLKDVDISIRRRALDLIYSLVNSKNVRMLIPDLINYLTFASSELKEDLTAKICTASERFAPTKNWHIDTLIKVLTLAGPNVPDAAASKLISLISQSEADMQGHAVEKLWSDLSGPRDGALLSKESLLLASVWCVGEFSDLLQKRGQLPEQEFAENVVVTVTGILQSVESLQVKQYCLNALLKVAVRFPNVQLLIIPTFEAYQASLDLELQQRAWEYLQMLQCEDKTIASAAADRMPVLETTSVMADLSQADGSQPKHSDASSPAPSPVAAQQQQQQQQQQQDAFLDDMFGAPPASQPKQEEQQNQQQQQQAPPQSTSAFSLDDIFGGSQTGSSSSPPPAASQPAASGIADFFGGPPAAAAAPPPPRQQDLGEVEVVNNNHLRLVFIVTRPDVSRQHDVQLAGYLHNKTSLPITDITLQVAVTKTATLQLHAMPTNVIPPGSFIVQQISVNNDNNGNKGVKPIAMKIRLSYTPANDGPQALEVTATGFPSTCA